MDDEVLQAIGRADYSVFVGVFLAQNESSVERQRSAVREDSLPTSGESCRLPDTVTAPNTKPILLIKTLPLYITAGTKS